MAGTLEADVSGQVLPETFHARTTGGGGVGFPVGVGEARLRAYGDPAVDDGDQVGVST